MILLNHVFEHLSDPRQAFERISNLLMPNGKLILVYPNLESIAARIWKENWFHWDAPRHLVIPPIKAVEEYVSAMPDLSLKTLKKYTISRALLASLLYSRAYSKGLLPEESSVNQIDMALSLFEKILVSLGIRLGEESVIVFERIESNATS